MDWVLATEGDRLFQYGIVRGGGMGVQGITVYLVSAVLRAQCDEGLDGGVWYSLFIKKK